MWMHLAGFSEWNLVWGVTTIHSGKIEMSRANKKLWGYNGIYGYGSIPINTILVGWTSIYQLFWCSAGVQGFDTLPFWAAQLRLSWWRFRFPMLLVNSGFPMLSQGFLQFFPFFPPIFHPTIPQSTCRTSSCTSSASSAQRVAPDASWNFAARLRYASRCQETNTWIKV